MGGGGVEVAAYLLVACLSHSTIDHASLSRRSIVPTLDEDPFKLSGAHYVFFHVLHRKCLLTLSPPVSLSVATIYLLVQRWFSRYYLVYQLLHVTFVYFLISNTTRSSL